MRDPNRIPAILDRIAKAWERTPDLRLGQLIINAVGEKEPDLFQLEDDVIATAIEKFVDESEYVHIGTVTKPM